MAHKKGGGSSRNGRDSNAQRRGVKRFGGEAIRAGTCAVGAYDPEGIDGLLHVDGQDEFAIYLAPVGKRRR